MVFLSCHFFLAVRDLCEQGTVTSDAGLRFQVARYTSGRGKSPIS